MRRIALVDLNGLGADPRVSSWNPLGMHHQQTGHEVVEAITDAYASALAWDDATAPRAIAILTAALVVLVAVNEAACQAGRPEDQATIFHVRALLTDTAFRKAALAAVADRLDEETRSWWQVVFPTLPPDAFAVVLNPIARLAANPSRVPSSASRSASTTSAPRWTRGWSCGCARAATGPPTGW